MPVSIESSVVVSRSPKSVVIKGKNPQSGIVSTILAFGCSILWPAVTLPSYRTKTVQSDQLGSETNHEIVDVHGCLGGRYRLCVRVRP
jgi:hypothetical protein